MRVETQRWDQVRISVEVVEDGAVVDSLAPEALLKRVSDGAIYDPGDTAGARWVGTTSTPITLTEDSDFDGLYEFSLPSADIDFEDHLEGYVVQIVNASAETPVFSEYLRICVDFSGEDLYRVLSLRQHNMRVTNTSFHSSGAPETGTVEVYPTAADAVADTNVLGSYAFTATYDSSGNLESYVSSKVS